MTHPANSSWEERIKAVWGNEPNPADPWHHRVFAIMDVEDEKNSPFDDEVHVVLFPTVPASVASHLVLIHNEWWDRNRDFG